MNKLKELAAEGNINPRYTTTQKIIDNYDDIIAARRNKHTWKEIAAAMGANTNKNTLLAAWIRVNEGIKSGRIRIPNAHSSSE